LHEKGRKKRGTDPHLRKKVLREKKRKKEGKEGKAANFRFSVTPRRPGGEKKGGRGKSED